MVSDCVGRLYDKSQEASFRPVLSFGVIAGYEKGYGFGIPVSGEKVVGFDAWSADHVACDFVVVFADFAYFFIDVLYFVVGQRRKV